jgi:hypothetical protein
MHRTLADSELQEHLQNLEERGYCYVADAYSPDVVEQALEKVAYWYEQTRCAHSERVPFLNRDQSMVYNL